MQVLDWLLSLMTLEDVVFRNGFLLIINSLPVSLASRGRRQLKWGSANLQTRRPAQMPTRLNLECAILTGASTSSSALRCAASIRVFFPCLSYDYILLRRRYPRLRCVPRLAG